MARYQITIAYDGTNFLGYQRQARGRTVQGCLEQALTRIGWQGSSILSAGRTDTGAHARGQVIAFDLDWKHTEENLQQALNANLPDDMVVRALRQARSDFHPRYDAITRCYRYRIYCQALRDPFLDRYAWRVWPAVVLADLQRAASLFLGTHDFAAFGKPPQPGGSTIRTIRLAGWQIEESCCAFEIASQAFLYHMVRRLVYFQVMVAQGRLELSEAEKRLENPADGLVQGLAPARGLELVEVTYPPGD